MSDTACYMDMLQDAFPKARHGSVYAAQYAAFDFMRRIVSKAMTVRRVRAIWEGKAQRIDAEEAEALKRAKIEEARREYAELRTRLQAVEAALAVADASAASAPMDQDRPAAAQMGRVDFP